MKHKHRIVPGHMGGTYDPENVVMLTVAEHIAAHKKLYEQYGKKEDRWAVNFLENPESARSHKGDMNPAWIDGRTYDMPNYQREWNKTHPNYQKEYQKKRRAKFIAQGLRHDGKQRMAARTGVEPVMSGDTR